MSRPALPTRAVVAAALAAGVLFGLAGTASASPAAPRPGDDRATAHAGNVVGKDCATLFPGSRVLGPGELTHRVDGTGTYLDVTAVVGGVEVAGVVVKGGPAYNTYVPARLGQLPWSRLHPPLVPSGKPAQISHWFACGQGGGTSTTTTTITTTAPSSTTSTNETTTTTTDVTSGPSTSTTTSTTSGSSTGASGGAGGVTTTTAGPVPAGSDSDLADTGFGAGWLLGLGALLLLGGGALLFLLRLRSARR